MVQYSRLLALSLGGLLMKRSKRREGALKTMIRAIKGTAIGAQADASMKRSTHADKPQKPGKKMNRTNKQSSKKK